MPTRKRVDHPPPTEVKAWSSPEEIDRAVAKIRRRIGEVEALQLPPTDDLADSPEMKIALSNIKETIRELFGERSPEFQDHADMSLWKGSLHINMSPHEYMAGKEAGRQHVLGILQGLVARLVEKKEDLTDASAPPSSKSLLQYLNMHPRIQEVSSDLLEDGYYWEAVFAACKALMNYVKEKSGKDNLDGAALMRTVFSRASPVLAFNPLLSNTDQDEQEGMMHLFEGVALGIRNPGGHAFPEGSEQRAVEYLSLISMLAYRVQESKKPK